MEETANEKCTKWKGDIQNLLIKHKRLTMKELIDARAGFDFVKMLSYALTGNYYIQIYGVTSKDYRLIPITEQNQKPKNLKKFQDVEVFDCSDADLIRVNKLMSSLRKSQYLNRDHVIGAGAYGSIFFLFDNGEMNVVKAEKINLGIVRSMPTEIDIMQNLNHRNIVPIRLITEKIDGHYPDCYAMPLGQNVYPTDVEKNYMKIMKEIVSALYYLHNVMEVYHLDIRPGNILYFPYDQTFKLIDFGLAADRKNMAQREAEKNDRDKYFAPERHGNRYKQNNQDVIKQQYEMTLTGKADIWSLGVWFLSFYSKGFRFIKDKKVIVSDALKGEKAKNFYEYVLKEVESKAIPNDLRVLLKKMLVINVKRRISAKDLLDEIEGKPAILSPDSKSNPEDLMDIEVVDAKIGNSIAMMESQIPQNMLPAFKSRMELTEERAMFMAPEARSLKLLPLYKMI